jgi:protein-S-isoprenylcysteine O-methyltransferase Ste14
VSRWAVTGLFGLVAAAFADDAVGAFGAAIEEPSFRGGAVAVYSVLRVGVLIAFTVFVFLREAPRRPSRDPVAFLACIAGLFALVALRKPDNSVATILVLAGDVVTVVAAAWIFVSILSLGRCFGVLPEARGLVTTGPYRIVRHPLYLGEFGMCAGFLIAAPVAWNLGVAVFFAGAQAVRMLLEERALKAEFGAYARYAATTPRLIPRLRRPELEYRHAG